MTFLEVNGTPCVQGPPVRTIRFSSAPFITCHCSGFSWKGSPFIFKVPFQEKELTWSSPCLPSARCWSPPSRDLTFLMISPLFYLFRLERMSTANAFFPSSGDPTLGSSHLVHPLPLVHRCEPLPRRIPQCGVRDSPVTLSSPLVRFSFAPNTRWPMAPFSPPFFSDVSNPTLDNSVLKLVHKHSRPLRGFTSSHFFFSVAAGHLSACPFVHGRTMSPFEGFKVIGAAPRSTARRSATTEDSLFFPPWRFDSAHFLLVLIPLPWRDWGSSAFLSLGQPTWVIVRFPSLFGAPQRCLCPRVKREALSPNCEFSTPAVSPRFTIFCQPILHSWPYVAVLSVFFPGVMAIPASFAGSQIRLAPLPQCHQLACFLFLCSRIPLGPPLRPAETPRLDYATPVSIPRAVFSEW